MPEFSDKKVQVLLATALAKAGAQLNRVGFEKLSQEIQKHPKINEQIISQRYIHERIYQQIKKTRVDGKSKISLKSEYLDELAAYLDFNDFVAFERRYSTVLDYMRPISFLQELNQISIIFNQNEEKIITSKCNQLLYPGQLGFIKFEPLNFNELKPEDFKNSFEPEHVSIILLNPNLLINQINLLKSIKNGLSEKNGALALWSESQLNQYSEFEEAISKLNWLVVDDIGLLVQCLLSEIVEPFSEKPVPRIKEKPLITNIRNSGTINLGKIGEIKAEYISSRDMHIIINKDKSQDK